MSSMPPNLPDPLPMREASKAMMGGADERNKSQMMDNKMPKKENREGGAFWRPMLIGNRMRTCSEDNPDSFDAFPAAGNMLDDSFDEPERPRRMSISEMFLGSAASSGRRPSADSIGEGEQKGPITENPKFKEFLSRQRKLIDDQA